MNKEWDLSVLYKGYDDPAYTADVEKLKAAIGGYQAYAAYLDEKDDAAQAIHEMLELEETATLLAYRIYAYTMLRSTTASTDAETAAYLGRLQELISSTNATQAVFAAYLAKIDDLDAVIAKDALLQEYAFLLHERKREACHVLDEKVEQAIAKMNLSGGCAWTNLQAYLTSTVTADYRGEQLTLSAIRNLAYDSDAQVRKDAYDAELACYEKIKDGVCFALNDIKKQVNAECELRGEISPLERTLRQSRMKSSTLDAMIAAIEEALPEFHKYLKAKAKALGYEGGLKWWDLFAPMGKNTAKYTVEQARDYLIAHFKGFAPDMADMMNRAFDEAWIDFYPHTGKVGGAFCENLPFIGQSRVLTNFDGTFGDIVTLAHELGHAYHGQQIETHRILNLEYSMPVAETASTFNETVIINAALAETNDREVKLGLLESQLQDTTQIICDIMSRYWFETAVFEKNEDAFPFPDELCAMMKQAQMKGYGDGVDADTLNPYMWVCKSHYYAAGLSFYNFPYAFGGLFSAGLYAQYRKEGEAFLPKYRKLLHATTNSTAEDVAAMAGIDLGDVDFWRSSMSIFKDRISRFIALLEA